MKKINIIFASFLIAGCQNTENSTIKNLEQNNIPDYTPASEDVIDMHGEIENKERFQEFLNNVGKAKKDSIRVVKYTEEGDPMLHDLEYDGEVIKSTTDTRRDKFGQGSIISTTCTTIEVVETTERTDYILEGCEDTIDNTVLVTWK
ncbi:DUF4362 domain-containing protein [Bacillus sp. FJAT-22090]|uniref:DUF4362 domain-containing protein n=1 Tax=Bacillus sp. FJAT-22090 TaxID=1581038 RepID=UPI0006AFB548|nr:DUF4362 domain-containing protein [Bacillus sp. FJAT-22090]